ncbi:MAG: hypothetical protein RLY20_190 [Verrucomicrobiota bacterium]
MRTAGLRFWLKLAFFLVFLALLTTLGDLFTTPVSAAELDAGPLFDEYQLTLRPGTQSESVGPFFYDQEAGNQETWAIPPLLSSTHDAGTDSAELDFLYPIITYDRFGLEYRLQFLQLLSFSGGGLQSGATKDQFTLFPFYFQQRSVDTNQNYTAFFPFHGTLKNRLFRDEINFTLWPLYIKTKRKPGFGSVGAEEFLSLANRYAKARRGDVTTYNYVAPFFHLRYGEGLRGWQLWPVVGRETKAVTTRTNMWGDPESIPGYEKSFIAWPIWSEETRDIGTTNASHFSALLPFYTKYRSPLRDSTSYGWPFGLTRTDDRAKKYRETDFLWPVYVYARGEGKTSTRVWPLFGNARSDVLESDFYLWPLYKYSRIKSDPLDRDRTRILLFLYSDTHEANTKTGHAARRVDQWPLFSYRKDFDGSTRFQALALLEPVLKGKSIERNYSPLWSLWRSEKNATNSATSQSLLWNLYRHQTLGDGSSKTSFLLGLFQHKRTADGTSLRLFFVPVKSAKPAVTAAVDSTHQLTHLPAGKR